MKYINKALDFMDNHCIALFGTWATGMLLWLLENQLKENN